MAPLLAFSRLPDGRPQMTVTSDKPGQIKIIDPAKVNAGVICPVCAHQTVIKFEWLDLSKP